VDGRAVEALDVVLWTIFQFAATSFVVRAAQVGAHLALLVVADPGAAVPADVVGAADPVVLAADDEDALVGDLDAQPRAGWATRSARPA
jgi:hypothetical protein